MARRISDIARAAADDLHARCPRCGQWQHIDDYQVCGADEGKVFCVGPWGGVCNHFKPRAWLTAAQVAAKASKRGGQ